MWALVVAMSLQRCDALCAAGTTGVDLILGRGYDLTGQTHIITGGDSGIGFGIAEAIAQANASIVLLGHDMKKTADVMRNITERTKNDKLSAIPINLMSLASVKLAVDAILAGTSRVDSVICDAGLLHPIHPSITEDGFESTLQVEYIAHFYLVELLLPQLRRNQGRVVHTSTLGIDSFAVCARSGLPEGCTTNLANFSKIVRVPNDVLTPIVDGNIFLALWMKTMHARILAHREVGSGVTAYSFHPGLVATSGDFDDFAKQYGGIEELKKMCSTTSQIDVWLPGMEAACKKNPAWQPYVDQCPFTPWFICMGSDPDGVMKACPLNSEQGGLTGTYLAAAPTSELAPINGALTVACDYVPELFGDPYLEMIGQIGSAATMDFLERFYELSLSWIPNAESSGQGVEAQVEHLTILTM